MTHKITLSNGEFALVDGADYEALKNMKWGKVNGYAHSKSGYMHRIIMGASKDYHVDHINNNILDNRRANLRLCSNSQNHMNIPKRSTSTSSRFKGVAWDGRTGKWAASIKKDYKKIWLGRHATEEGAARAYNEAAKKHFGEFASLNPVD